MSNCLTGLSTEKINPDNKCVALVSRGQLQANLPKDAILGSTNSF